jgi:hypothetical protein
MKFSPDRVSQATATGIPEDVGPNRILLPQTVREKRLSPRRASKQSLLPHSPKRTLVRLKSLLKQPGFARFLSQPTAGLQRKSAVYGLNGQRVISVIALSLVTYGDAIYKSRSFTALFSRTLTFSHENYAVSLL